MLLTRFLHKTTSMAASWRKSDFKWPCDACGRGRPLRGGLGGGSMENEDEEVALGFAGRCSPTQILGILS